MRKASLTKYIILFFMLGIIYTESIAKSPTIKPSHVPTQPPIYSNPQYPETPPPNRDENKVEPPRDNNSELSVFLDFFGDLSKNPHIQKNVLPFLTIVLGAILAWLTNKLKKLSRRLSGPRFSLPKRSIESVNRVLLIGLGGSGKTSLIQKITAHPDAEPRIKSADFKTYSLVHEITKEEEQHVCRIDIDDYRGQNVGQVIKKWIDRKLIDEDHYAQSLIIIVDIFPPFSPTDTISSSAIISSDRVAQHIHEWSDNALGAVMEVSSNSHVIYKYICLFINKSDLLIPWNTDSEQIVKDAFKPLIDIIARRSAGALFEVIVGSTLNDTGVVRLLHSLIKRAEINDGK